MSAHCPCQTCLMPVKAMLCLGFMASLLLPVSAAATEAVVGHVDVRTRSAANPSVRAWYRVPAEAHGPRPTPRRRVLVIFGGRNCDGRAEVSGKLGWPAWADLNGVVLVAPTLRDDAYWDPARWSGRALLDALAALPAECRASPSGLLCYGYSAGSQAANLFAAWRPDLCRAYAAHACGVFHEPSPRTSGVAGLVTCGDADASRYVLGRRFVAECRRVGLPVLWKSFPNRPHDVPERSVRLAQEFLARVHWSRADDLGGRPVASAPEAFVGDDSDGTFHRAGSSEAAAVASDDRVDLPSEAVASAWGRPGRELAAEFARRRPAVWTNAVRGVETVTFAPPGVRPDARVLVLLGGRGWTGARAVADFGFRDWAAARGWCLVAPSFAGGEWWRSTGAAGIVSEAVETVRRRHGLRPLPVFLFGHSAGGELAARLQADPPFAVAAWGVHGCGVFPDGPCAGAPGLVLCGEGDAARLPPCRLFACRFREAGGLLVWKTLGGGHPFEPAAGGLARAFFSAAEKPRPCSVWGEDDTLLVRTFEAVDPEYRNPLWTDELKRLWSER